MTKEQLIDEMIQVEWEMFHNVNGETRANCQEDPSGFYRMRGAQYKVWNEAVCESYYQDLLDAKSTGRNLPREKYIYMMATTAPAEYQIFASELPKLSERKIQLVEDIWAITGKQTEVLRQEYPLIALGGRPLHDSDAYPGQTSVETYQKGELMTYSERTLSLLLDQIKAMLEEGKSYAHDVQLETVLAAGYSSLRNAEEVMLAAARKRIKEAEIDELLKQNTGCPNCVQP